jgi:hypothetical protein
MNSPIGAVLVASTISALPSFAFFTSDLTVASFVRSVTSTAVTSGLPS